MSVKKLHKKIINSFPPQKRLKIALDFPNMSVDQTRKWMQESNPYFSELEINLEFVKLMYYDSGQMSDEVWEFYASTMKKKIKKNWADRFRKMMTENKWNYDVSPHSTPSCNFFKFARYL